MSDKNLLKLLPVLFILVLNACNDKDKTEPVIVLNNAGYTVRLGSPYVEQGALATDKEQGVLDSSLLIIDTSQVRTDSVGDFEVRYYVADNAGNEDSTIRTFGVYASRLDYMGTWNVSEVCVDTEFQNYLSVIDTFSIDTTAVKVSNLRNQGTGVQIDMFIRGRLGRAIELTDTIGELSYAGTSVLAVGTVDSFRFELNFTEKDSLDSRNCNATFTK